MIGNVGIYSPNFLRMAENDCAKETKNSLENLMLGRMGTSLTKKGRILAYWRSVPNS